ADDISGSMNIGHRSAISSIHLQLPSGIRNQTDGFKVELVGVAGTSVRPQYDIALDALAGFEMGHSVGIKVLQFLILLIVTAAHTHVTQVIAERIGDFIIEK